MVKIVNDEKFDILRILLIILFVVVWTMKRVIVFEFIVDSHIIHYVFAFLSLSLVIIDLITKQRILKGKNVILLICLCFVMLLSTVILRIDLVENMSTIIFVGTQFLLFYSYPSGQKKERVKSDSILLSTVFCVWFTFFTTIQVLTYLFNLFYDAVSKTTGDVFSQGYNIWVGRTWGVFYYPSTLILAIVSIGLACYLLKNNSIPKLVGIYFIITNYLGIVLCGARSVQYAFYCFVFFMVLLCMNKRFAINVIAAVLLVGIIFGISSALSHILPYIQNGLYKSISPNAYSKILNVMERIYDVNGYYVKGYFVNVEVDSETGKEIFEQGLSILQDVERYDLEGKDDLSNNRVALWREGVQLFKDHPLLGTSPRGMIDYAKENYPNYLISTKDWPLHNAYLDVPVQTGIIGCIFFYGFAISIIVYFGRYLFNFWETANKDILYLLPIIVSMCIYLLVESDVFLQYTAQAMMFWFILGVISAFVRFDMEDKRETISNT